MLYLPQPVVVSASLWQHAELRKPQTYVHGSCVLLGIARCRDWMNPSGPNWVPAPHYTIVGVETPTASRCLISHGPMET